MAACGATHRLLEHGAFHQVFDKGNHPGGHTKTYEYEGGWTFDDGPHVSFTKDARIQAILAASIDGDFLSVPTGVNNYWRGHWVKHPAQCNLYGLPTDLVVRCIADFVSVSSQPMPEVDNYEEWLIAAYGRTFAENFPFSYTRKIHCTEAANLTTDWMGPRLYRPSLEEVLRGALSPDTEDVHYIEGFRYPRQGGFYSYLEPIFERSQLHMDHEVVAIRPETREVEFANGRAVAYSGLVSSIPLPSLIPLISGAPDEVVEAARSLSYSGCVFVNLGIERELETPATWTYIYDEDVSITRLSFPHRFSPEAVPPGCSAIQCEIYYSPRYKPLVEGRDNIARTAVADLVRCGVLRNDDRILLKETVVSPFANVIFDHDRNAALRSVHGFLDEVGIKYCGRFGDWDYLWTDQAFASGERAAEAAVGDQGQG